MCGPGVSGYVIARVLDIRRFPTFPKLKAFAAFHLIKKNGGWQAPKMTKGERANWDHVLQQAVVYFIQGTNKSEISNPWKAQLEMRYLYEAGKLLAQRKLERSEIPADLTTEKFFDLVREIRTKAAEEKRIPELPEPYKGIPALARKRAMRWLGQKFLQYVWTEWRRFEGITQEAQVMADV